MHASDVWIDKLAMFISQICALYCWSAVVQRCRRRRRLPPVHRLPPGGDPWHEQRREFGCDLVLPSTEKMFVWPPAFPLRTRFSAIFFHTVLSNYQKILDDFFEIEVYITKKRWLFHQMCKWYSDQFNSQVANHLTSHSSFSLVSRLTADVYRYDDHSFFNYLIILCRLPSRDTD